MIIPLSSRGYIPRCRQCGLAWPTSAEKSGRITKIKDWCLENHPILSAFFVVIVGILIGGAVFTILADWITNDKKLTLLQIAAERLHEIIALLHRIW